MGKKILSLFVVLLLVVVLAAGCGNNQSGPAPGPSGPEPAEPKGAFPLTITDDAGKQFTIESEPARIISMAPSLTEILFALDLGDKVVGVTDWCNYPGEALEVAKIGDAFTPNAEVIISLEPDVVLAPQSAAIEEITGLLESNGVTVMVFDPKTIDAINDSIISIAMIAGAEDKGRELAAGLAAGRRDFEGRAALISGVPRVFVLLDTEYIFTVGDGEYLSEMIAAVGAVNAAAGYGEGYPMLSEEILFEIDPDIIICTFPMSDQVLAKKAWQELSAVKSGRVYDVDGDLVTRPGPRILLGLEELYNVFFE